MRRRYSFFRDIGLSTDQWMRVMIIPIMMLSLAGCNFAGQETSNLAGEDASSGSNVTDPDRNEIDPGEEPGRTDLPERTIRFGVLSASQSEGDATVVNAVVELGAALDVPLTVPITIGGTAGVGSDVKLIVAPTIPAGQLSANIAIEIIDDVSDEPDETVVLSLRAPTGITVDSPNSTFTLTILDDDLSEEEKNPSQQYPALQLVTNRDRTPEGMPDNLSHNDVIDFVVEVKIKSGFPMTRLIDSVELLGVGYATENFFEIVEENCTDTLIIPFVVTPTTDSNRCQISMRYDSGGVYSWLNNFEIRIASRTYHNGEPLDDTLQIQDLPVTLKMERLPLFLATSEKIARPADSDEPDNIDFYEITLTRNPAIESYVNSDQVIAGGGSIYDVYLSGMQAQENNGTGLRTAGVFEMDRWHDCNRTLEGGFDQGFPYAVGDSCKMQVRVDTSQSGTHSADLTVTYTTSRYGATKYVQDVIEVTNP